MHHDRARERQAGSEVAALEAKREELQNQIATIHAIVAADELARREEEKAPKD